MYLNEDMIALWGIKNKGLVITRSQSNLNTFNFNNNNNEVTVCIITGYNHIVKTFFNDIIHRMNRALLIIIETDIVNIKKEWLNNERLIHCYTWNKPYEHSKMTTLPIGLNFKRQYKSILTWIQHNKINEESLIVRDKLLCFNCSLSTSTERKILKNIIDNKLGTFCNKLPYIPFKKTEYIKSFIEGRLKIDITDPKCYDYWKQYKFILSPQGAGLDCHRTWEALMVGCIPIVKSSSINEIYKDLPIVIVNKWEDLSIEFLNDKYNTIMQNKKRNNYNYKKLYSDFWFKEFEKKMKLKTTNIDRPICLKKQKIHFITYGNNRFEIAKKRLLKEAKNFNEFETIKGYGPQDLSQEVLKKHNKILNMKRGGGYWIWRPYILQMSIDNMEENDFLVYLDAGCKLNIEGKKRFYEYINLLNNSEYGIMSFQMSGKRGPGSLEKEKWWSIKEIFNYFKIDLNSDIANSGQYLGGVLIMKKNQHLMTFMKEFLKIIDLHSDYCTDNYNTSQHHFFKENRHEQSITSILRKKIGSVVIDCDESWFPPFGKGESLKYPFWATRSKI